MKRMPSPAVWACLMAATLLSGCAQKKPAVAVPQTPTAAQQPPASQPTPGETQPQTRQPQASPTQGTPPPEPQPSPQPALQPGEPAQPAQPAAEKPESTKARTAKPRANAKKAGTETARKTTVPPDGAGPAPAAGQISPSLSHAEIARDQATTEQLLQGTESTLNGITRQLSEDEKAIATQIRDYVKQSRQASQANDLTRAYNLAMKARLLADDLAKRR